MSIRYIWIQALLYTGITISTQNSSNEIILKSLITPIEYAIFYTTIEMYHLESNTRKSITPISNNGSRIKSGNVQRPLSSVPSEIISNLLMLVKSEYSPELHNMADALHKLEMSRLHLYNIIKNGSKESKSDINQILTNVSIFLETYQRNIALFNGLFTQWAFGKDSQITYIENKSTENEDFRLSITNKEPRKENPLPEEQEYSYESLNIIEVFLAELDTKQQIAEQKTLAAIDSFKSNREKFHAQQESLDIIKQNAYDLYLDEIAYRNTSAQCFLPFSINALSFLQHPIASSSQTIHNNHLYTCVLESNKYQSLQRGIMAITDHITTQIPSDRSLLPQEKAMLNSRLNKFITLCKSDDKNNKKKNH